VKPARPRPRAFVNLPRPQNVCRMSSPAYARGRLVPCSPARHLLGLRREIRPGASHSRGWPGTTLCKREGVLLPPGSREGTDFGRSAKAGAALGAEGGRNVDQRRRRALCGLFERGRVNLERPSPATCLRRSSPGVIRRALARWGCRGLHPPCLGLRLLDTSGFLAGYRVEMRAERAGCISRQDSVRCDLPGLSPAVPAHHDDDDGRAAWGAASAPRHAHGSITSPAARDLDGGRVDREPDADALHLASPREDHIRDRSGKGSTEDEG
jgi:hypothetical protein